MKDTNFPPPFSRPFSSTRCVCPDSTCRYCCFDQNQGYYCLDAGSYIWNFNPDFPCILSLPSSSKNKGVL